MESLSDNFLFIKKRIAASLFVVIFVFILKLVFLDVCDMFSEVVGYQCRDQGTEEWLLFGLISVLPVFFMPLIGKSPSAVVLWVVYLSHLIPSVIVMRAISEVPFEVALMWTVAIVVLFVLIVFLSKNRLDIRLKLSIRYETASNFLIFIGAVFVILMVNTYGFSIEPPSIDDVYGVRSEYKDALAASGSAFMGYVPILGGFSVAPLLLLLAVRFYRSHSLRSWLMVFLSLFLSFVIYSSAGFKSVAFSSLVVFLAYFVLRRVKNYGYFLSMAIPFFVFFNFICAYLFGWEIVLYHWIRRVFISPGMNTTYFFDYLYYFDVFKGYPPEIVSKYYYGTDGSANAGLFGDAIGRFGVLGLFLNSFLLLMSLKFLDSLSRSGDPIVSGSLSFLAGYAISNSSLSTVLFSYGFVFSGFLLFLLRKHIS
ncbi:hypothetical protein [Zoogloea sp.]|jgi:hypothetical protein|uniref:hypothetical protein n=1 Tax=Zoogloea sp. TaxID=49181 RepID=UPI0035B01108